MEYQSLDLRDLPIDRSWTLFLDRDGVINTRLIGDYVKTREEFEFLPGVLDAIAMASKVFGRIIVVTNQKGVGRGIMTHEALEDVHTHMLEHVQVNGGSIHAVYSAINLEENDHDQRRKPGIGMALQAKTEYPEIDFSRAVMVGDSDTDIQFGKNLGMTTVLIGDKESLAEDVRSLTDYTCDSLANFARRLRG